jgi:hypothetical protein
MRTQNRGVSSCAADGSDLGYCPPPVLIIDYVGVSVKQESRKIRGKLPTLNVT